jgi:hypothetical protein
MFVQESFRWQARFPVVCNDPHMRIVLITVVSAALLAGSALGGPLTPRVRLVERSPAEVSGSAFGAGERVAVRLTAGTLVLRKTVVATAKGTFVARWTRSIPDGCVGVSVVATGSAGSRAAFKLAPPDCAPLQPAGR